MNIHTGLPLAQNSCTRYKLGILWKELSAIVLSDPYFDLDSYKITIKIMTWDKHWNTGYLLLKNDRW